MTLNLPQSSKHFLYLQVKVLQSFQRIVSSFFDQKHPENQHAHFGPKKVFTTLLFFQSNYALKVW
jgi:hypothetical protein